MPTPTPHNAARKGQIAKTVLMPGDPLRAQFIAETYLEDPAEFNRVRGMLGFTGTYKGKPVSVMGSGMGMASMGIYSYELFTEYDVDAIIRVGSAAGYADTLKLYDVIMVTESFSESTFAKCQGGFDGNIIRADDSLCRDLRESAQKLGYPITEGATHSSDIFYYGPGGSDWKEIMRERGCICVEMESYALFHNARVTGKTAACLVTISDMMEGGQATSAGERERGFTRMMEIALGVL